MQVALEGARCSRRSPPEAMELMLGKMGKTPSHAEFLAAMSTMG